MRIRVLRIIDRLNVGGPALQATVLTRGLDPDRFEHRLLAGSVGPDEGDYLALRAPDHPGRADPRAGPGAPRLARRRRAGPDRACDPALPTAHRAHAQGEGRGARAPPRVRASRARHRPHLPRPPAPRLLLPARDRRGHASGTGVGQGHDSVGRRGCAGPRGAPRGRRRQARAVLRRAAGSRSPPSSRSATRPRAARSSDRRAGRSGSPAGSPA